MGVGQRLLRHLLWDNCPYFSKTSLPDRTITPALSR